MSYNGWPNRETWVLWNRGFFDGYYGAGSAGNADHLADLMYNDFDEYLADKSKSDLLSDFIDIDAIDFLALAEAYIEQHPSVIGSEGDEEDDDEEDDEEDEDEEDEDEEDEDEED